MNISAKTTICAFVANPAGHTASPVMHNAAYQAQRLDFLYLAFQVTDIGKALQAMRTLQIRGFSVSIPHKVDAMQFLDAIDPTAQAIGAINTVVNEQGKLTGYNTDYLGALKALEEKTSLGGKSILLLGAGGAGRAIAFGIAQKKGNLSICDRDSSRATELAQTTSSQVVSTEELEFTLKTTDIIIHATPVGMHPNVNETPLPKEWLQKNHIVFDIVYVPQHTQLIQDAQAVGCTIVYGYKMLLYQAVKQFELFTQQEAPLEVMEQALLDFLNRK